MFINKQIHVIGVIFVTMPRIDLLKREQVLLQLRAGLSQRKVATNFGISLCATQNIWKKGKETGDVKDRQKSGRPRKNTLREQRRLVILSKFNPKFTAKQLCGQWRIKNLVSVDTVKRILRRYGLYGRIAAKKPLLTKRQIRTRLQWCKANSGLTDVHWSNVIFSDETKIEMHPRRREYVRRSRGSRYNDRYTTKTVKFGGKSLMLWGCIRGDGTRMLINCPPRLDSEAYQEVLNAGLLPLYDEDNVFMQDGAPCHRSRSTKAFLEEKEICVLDDWPSQSPDLNIIEPLWDVLKTRVYSHNACTLDELWKFCQLEWRAIKKDYIQALYRDIPKRLRAVIRAGGRNTKY
jgi:transposase